MMEESKCPGGLTVAVDKVDGHIWTLEERSQIFGEVYLLEASMDVESRELLEFLLLKLALRHAVDVREDRKKCLKGRGLIVGAIKHEFPKIVSAEFGINPNMHIWIRGNPPHYESIHLLILSAVNIFLEHSDDCILLSDKGRLFPILVKSLDGVTLNGAYPWTEKELGQFTFLYKFGSF